MDFTTLPCFTVKAQLCSEFVKNADMADKRARRKSVAPQYAQQRAERVSVPRLGAGAITGSTTHAGLGYSKTKAAPNGASCACVNSVGIRRGMSL